MMFSRLRCGLNRNATAYCLGAVAFFLLMFLFGLMTTSFLLVNDLIILPDHHYETLQRQEAQKAHCNSLNMSMEKQEFTPTVLLVFFLPLSRFPTPVNLANLHSVSDVIKEAINVIALPEKLRSIILSTDFRLFVISRKAALHIVKSNSLQENVVSMQLGSLDSFDVKHLCVGSSLLLKLEDRSQKVLLSVSPELLSSAKTTAFPRITNGPFIRMMNKGHNTKIEQVRKSYHTLLKSDVLPMCGPACNIFVSFDSKYTGNGYGMWGYKMDMTLRLLATIRTPPLEPNENTIAAFFQGLDSTAISILRQIGPLHALRTSKKIFIGPFAADKWNDIDNVTILLNNTIFMPESKLMVNECCMEWKAKKQKLSSDPFEMGCSNVATAVEMDPSVKSTADSNPILYIKKHSGLFIDETLLNESLQKADVPPFTIFRTSHHGPDSYKREEYVTALYRAPFMVAFTPSETWGYFLLEAASLNVPILLLHHKGGVPEWFNPSCGNTRHIHRNGSFLVSEMSFTYNNFLQSVRDKKFEPLQFVLNSMSIHSVAEKLRVLIMQ